MKRLKKHKLSEDMIINGNSIPAKQKKKKFKPFKLHGETELGFVLFMGVFSLMVLSGVICAGYWLVVFLFYVGLVKSVIVVLSILVGVYLCYLIGSLITNKMDD